MPPVSYQQVLAQLDPEAIARDTLAFVRVPSETGAEGAGGEHFAELCERAGLEVEVDRFIPERPNVYARLAGTAPGRPLLLNGHLDTIPRGASDPPDLRDGWVIGRGAEDMKGGLVAMVHAAMALRRARVRLRSDLWLSGVVGHETPVGKKEGPLRLVERIRAGDIPAAAVIIAEGPQAIWTAGLGAAMFRITLSSARGIVHTLHVPFAANPARWAGAILEEFAEWEARFEAETPHPLCGRQRVDVGLIAGGDYPNRLPTPLTLRGTRRWRHGLTATEIEAELRELCERIARRSGLEAEFSLDAPHEPFETPADHPLVRALETAAPAATGAALPRIGLALVTDANIFANAASLPVVCCGPEYATAHSDHERVSVERLHQTAALYALAAMEFCGVEG